MRPPFLLALVVTGCTNGSGGVDPVEIRACNDTEFDFAAFEYDAPGDRGPLLAGTCTTYELAESTVYDYAYVRFTIDQDVFELVPIDFVGETPLDPGRWSYQVSILDYDARAADIQAVED